MSQSNRFTDSSIKSGECGMKNLFLSLLVIFAAVMSGCGGGGGASAPSILSGTASQGSPLPAGTTVITVFDSKGGSRQTTVVGASGAYNIAVDGMTAPFVLKAAVTNGPLYYSFALAPGVANINPITNLSMQIALGGASLSDSVIATFTAGHFQAFNSLAVSLEQAIDGLYPASVPATQRDFLHGTIVIDGGVDKVFSLISVTPPDQSGNFSAKVSGQIIFNGTFSSTGVTLTSDPVAIAAARDIVFPANNSNTAFTAALVSGKTFSFSMIGTDVHNKPTNKHGTTVFNADHAVVTTVISAPDPDVVALGNWSINSSDQLVVTYTAAGEVNTLSLESSTATTVVATDAWANSNNSGSGTMTLTLVAN
jgi:hypothetical protein